MCIQDVRLARRQQSRSVTVAAAGGRGTTALPANANRMSITASAALGDAIAAGEQVIIGTQTEGGLYPILALNSHTPFGLADLQAVGVAVTGEIVVFTGDGITPNVIVGESVLLTTAEDAVQ